MSNHLRVTKSCSKMMAVALVASMLMVPVYAEDTTILVNKTVQSTEVTTTGAVEVTTASQVTFKLGDKAYKKANKSYNMDVAPQIVEGKIMVPIKYVSEALSADVKYDNAAKKVTVTTADGKVAVLTLGKSQAVVDGKKVDLGTKVFIENSRTYVPVGSVGRLLGATVTWDNTTKTATFN